MGGTYDVYMGWLGRGTQRAVVYVQRIERWQKQLKIRWTSDTKGRLWKTLCPLSTTTNPVVYISVVNQPPPTLANRESPSRRGGASKAITNSSSKPLSLTGPARRAPDNHQIALPPSPSMYVCVPEEVYAPIGAHHRTRTLERISPATRPQQRHVARLTSA